MNARKFFKRSRLSDIRESSESDEPSDSKKSRLDLNRREPEIDNYEFNEEESNDSDSGLSGFESSASSLSSFDFEDDFANNFEPLFRSSTPLPNCTESFSQNTSSSTTRQLDISKAGEKVNLWQRAMSDNPRLRDWVDGFNEEMKQVEESELNIKTKSSK